MDRRDFFKFLRDGGVALVAAVTVGIPKIDDKPDVVSQEVETTDAFGRIRISKPTNDFTPVFIGPDIELVPRKSIPEAIAEKLRGENPDIPVYPNHENCNYNNVAEFIDTGIWSGINWQEIE